MIKRLFESLDDDTEIAFDYKSPVSIIQERFRTEVEDNVMKTISGYHIVVDKEELIKALNYDRAQYQCGYTDGYTDGYESAKKYYLGIIKEALEKEGFEVEE